MSTPGGPPRPGSWLAPQPSRTDPSSAHLGPPASPGTEASVEAPTDDLATALAGVPVSAHADVLAAEHDRLHRLLATIDQL